MPRLPLPLPPTSGCGISCSIVVVLSGSLSAPLNNRHHQAFIYESGRYTNIREGSHVNTLNGYFRTRRFHFKQRNRCFRRVGGAVSVPGLQKEYGCRRSSWKVWTTDVLGSSQCTFFEAHVYGNLTDRLPTGTNANTNVARGIVTRLHHKGAVGRSPNPFYTQPATSYDYLRSYGSSKLPVGGPPD